MGQESARHGLAHQQTDHGVPGQTGLGIAVDGTGQGLMDTQGFLAAAIGLARHIDDGDQGALDRPVAVGGDRFIHRPGQAPAFQQADFAVAGTGERVGGVGDHGDKAHWLPAQYPVGDFQGCGQAGDLVGVAAQGVEPDQATLANSTHERSP
ncbi:hypothetical protein D3C85_990290 [compost metagenome]